MTRCTICNRELTNPVSIAKGIGPVCEKKKGKSLQFKIVFAPMEKCVYCGQLVKRGCKHFARHINICPAFWK